MTEEKKAQIRKRILIAESIFSSIILSFSTIFLCSIIGGTGILRLLKSSRETFNRQVLTLPSPLSIAIIPFPKLYKTFLIDLLLNK